jgi:hypothetical protein
LLSIIKQIAETASNVSTLLEVSDNDLNIESSINLVTKVKQNIPTNKSKVDLEVISKLHDQETIEAIEKFDLDCRIYCKKHNDLSDYVVSPNPPVSWKHLKLTNLRIELLNLFLLDHILELKLNEIVKFSDTLKEKSIKLRNVLTLGGRRKLLGMKSPCMLPNYKAYSNAYSY